MGKNRKKRRIRIAVIGHKVMPSRRGGIELVVTTLCPMFVKKGYRVTCYNRQGDRVENEYVGRVRRRHFQGVRLKTVPALQKRGLSAVTSSFFASVSAAFGRYDIVHYHAEGPSAMLWIPKLFGKKCIVTVHGLDWQRDKWSRGFGAKYIKFGEKVLARLADEIIVLSANAKQYFYDNYGRQCVYIPNGVSESSRRPAEMITQKYGLTKDSYYCAVARLAQEKGLHYLIEAYLQLNTERKLVIAGDSSDTDEYVRQLKQMAKGNPNIIFTGFVTGKLLEELYSNAYVFVIPSNIEGMPLTLLEAMSYANCVLGSDIPEITEVVEDKAVIFKKGSVEALTERLQMLDRHPEIVQEYRDGAADFITQKYSWEKTASQTEKLYRTLLRKHTRPMGGKAYGKRKERNMGR